MEEAKRCPECGAQLEQEGDCPACLMRLGMSGAIPAMPEPEPRPAPPPPARPRFRWRLGWKWPLAAAAAIAVLFLMLTPHRSEPMRGPVVRFTIAPPGEAAIQDFAVSPDGRRLVFTAASLDGPTKLWRHDFDASSSQELPGTDGAAAPFWSPDSRHIAFFAGGKLKRMEVAGGAPMTLADAPFAQGGSWSPQGGIIFAGRGDGLLRVSASGGEVMPVAHGDKQAFRWPSFLPDGVSFLCHSSTPEKGTYVGRIDTGEFRKISDDEAAIYSDAFLIYTRNGTLVSQPFDSYRLKFSGEPVPVRFAEPVEAGSARAPAFSAEQGVLAYRNGDASSPRMLVWMDRQGKFLGRPDQPTEEAEFSLSPDGRKVAFTRKDTLDVWVRDLDRGTSTRLTFDGPRATSPKWSPDGRRIVYVASVRGKASVQVVSADGSGNPEMLLALQPPQIATLNDWSRDGRFLIYTQSGQGLWMFQLQGESKPTVVSQGPFHFKQARLSPDGRWLAYVSDEAGREDVYVQSFPPGRGKWMISNQGGAHPMWRGDGKELFYIQSQRQLMSTAIRSGSVVEPGVPTVLLELPGNGPFEVSPDGQRFLVSAPSREERPEPIHIVLQWASETRP